VLYSTGNTTPPPQQHLLYPTTIHHTTNVCFTVTTSHYKFPEEQPLASPDLWIHTTVPEAFQNAHPIYQHLLNTLPTDNECQDIAQELSQGHLVACSDGAYAKKTATSNHAQVFASGLVCNIVATGVSPVDGHPALLSSYRSELSGFLAALYIVFRICQHYNITTGQMTLYCDNKGALRTPFALSRRESHPTSLRITI